MRYYTFWVKERLHITVGNAEETITLLTGSNRSEEAARQKAADQAKQIEKRIAEGALQDSYESIIKEHVAEILDDANIITVCRYGAKILNSTEYTILDLGDFPVDFFDRFKAVGKLSKKERIICKFEERIKKFPELGNDFRIYETAKGIRVIGKKYVDPSSRSGERMMTALNVDSLYHTLSQKQNCYRTRLTPKPYRMKSKTIKITSPLDCLTEKYSDWEKQYREKSQEYSTVHLIKTLGADFSRDPVIIKHDTMCHLFAEKKLA